MPYSDSGPASRGPLPADRRAYALLALLLGLSLLTALLTQGTYDSSDSIMHYLFARYAFQHPVNFLESWSKPLVVQVMAGPAQLGLRGVMVLQCLLVATAAGLAYDAARQLRLPWPWLVLVFCYASADYFRIQFSGLTEPTFSVVLMAAVALALRGQVAWGAAVISLLPYARSEGFLLLGVYGLYVLIARNWRALPWLGLGFMLYGIAGLFVYQDFLWVFTHNAYPVRNTDYTFASGQVTHFILGLADTIGWVQYGLLWLGVGGITWAWVRPGHRLRPDLFRAEVVLVYGCIVVFVAAHTVFWMFNLFGSLGLVRVLCSLVPLLSLVVLRGVWVCSQLFAASGRRRQIRAALLVVVVGFPFCGSRIAFRWERDFGRASDQLLLDEAARWAARQQVAPQMVYWHPYVAMATGLDPFGPRHSPPEALQTQDWPLPAGSLVFWDEWYAVIEGSTPLEALKANPHLRLRWLKAMPRNRKKTLNDSVRVAVFEKI
ncbi:hypothetical protein [Hymenobacter metallilatus]|uniref:Glycosyltransferase RgtA/B/C/D-like domain-containing protein n=1 Tax=Hymenobacter metallilatus TaxID=2493666 RepID=A0A3R9MB16_9BACT|nr:hypothetical protein [Hymenobacter metallilatus]RSK35286.1 hypothetical protein EI290_06190 [Hymenobacter metallilatus]